MIRKIARSIVSLRIPILIACAVLVIACAFTISRVNINYDFTRYLAEDTMTRKSLEMMEREFGSSEQLRVMLTDWDDADFEAALSGIQADSRVLNAAHSPETGDKTVDGKRHRLISITLNDVDALQYVRDLRAQLSDTGECVVAGSAANTLDIQASLAREVIIAMVIAVIVVLGVLLATSHAWAEPVPILLVLVIAIVINMGTNWVFDTISFVTFAVCAILQLALSMDYAIMLLHTYDELRDEGMGDKDAMAEALARSFMPVSSSALTTVAGLLSLMFMSFTIGFDIGIVLAKGIIVSMLTVFLAMPALILTMPGLLRRTAHKPLPLGGKYVARFAFRGRFFVTAVLIAVIGVSVYLQSMNSYTFTDEGRQKTAQEITTVYGENNVIAVLVPVGETDADYAKQQALIDEISAIEIGGKSVVTGVQAMVTTGAQALEYYSARDVADMLDVNLLAVNLFFAQQGFGETVRADELIKAADALMPGNETVAGLKSQLDMAEENFNGAEHARMIFTVDMPYASDDTYAVVERMIELTEAAYGDNTGVVGSSVSGWDISHAFTGDLNKVNIITIAAILLIIALSFRSVSVPVILVCVIQGAVNITMAISYLMDEQIFFMSYLICIAMQMGATVDYGILLTSHYRAARKTMGKKEALSKALTLSLPTICTSGLILVTAGFIVGKVCTVFYVSSIGLLLARGASISIILILTLLPSLLILLDKVAAGKDAVK